MFISLVMYNTHTKSLMGPTEWPFSIRRLPMIDLSLRDLNKGQNFLKRA
jgi:hypothetical protein